MIGSGSGSGFIEILGGLVASASDSLGLLLQRGDFRTLLWPGLFATGVWLLLGELHRGRSRLPLRELLSRQDLERRLRETLEERALSSPGPSTAAVDEHPRTERDLFPPVLKRMVRPILADLGWLLRGILSRLAPGLVGGSTLERDLHLVRSTVSAGGFVAEKMGAGLLWLAIPPAFAALGGPHTPPVAWVVAGMVGFLLPDVDLKRRLVDRRTRVVAELPAVLDQLVIATSAGLSLEQAIDETAASSTGLVADELQRVVTELGVGRWRSLQEGLAGLDRRNGVPELGALVGQLRAASQQGVPVAQVLAAQADSLRERQKAALVAAGGRATVRMVIPIAIFILPVLAVVVLVPAAVQLLQLRG